MKSGLGETPSVWQSRVVKTGIHASANANLKETSCDVDDRQHLFRVDETKLNIA